MERVKEILLAIRNNLESHVICIWQHVTRGFSDADLWNLDMTMAKFLFPRLKRYKEHSYSLPEPFTPDEWNAILDKMIKAMDIIANGKWGMPSEQQEKLEKEVDEGLELFGKYFRYLWI